MAGPDSGGNRNVLHRERMVGKGVLRRFFQLLEQGVLGLDVHLAGVGDEHHPVCGFMGPGPCPGDDLPDPGNGDGFLRLRR
jgi:hypothetical protein